LTSDQIEWLNSIANRNFRYHFLIGEFTYLMSYLDQVIRRLVA